MKKNYKRLLPLCCICFFSCLNAIAQNEATLNNLQQQFNNYQQQAEQEKVFVHTNKDFFLAGDLLWFKVYALDVLSNKPTELSKVAYVEIIDGDKKPVLQAKIKLAAGSGNGSFHLPTSVRSGNYVVRAYTNWMKNFSPDLYFSKSITIVNTFKDLDAKKTADTAQYDMRFFPEGGNLVDGIQSKVGFRIIDQYGKGVDCSGNIVDQNGQAVIAFKPQKFGIGNFTFIPSAANKYTAVVTIGNKTITQALPVAYASGYVMQVQDAGNQISINVTGANVPPSVYLLVNTGQNLKTAEVKQLQNGKTAFAIDKAKLGDGVTHLTLFNDQAQPVCERLYFKRPQQQLLIDAKANKDEFSLRQKVSIGINAKDEGNAPQMADMSMSVYRLDSLQTISNLDITAYLLLNADIRGTVENPGYYFANSGAEADVALDNLMLTHGWSRFKWDEILQNKTAFEYIPEYEGHAITARVTDKKTGQPAENIVAYLSVPGKNYRLTVAKSNKNGIVQFNVTDFVGGDELILQTNQTQDSAYRIDIVNPFSEKFTGIQTGAFGISEKVSDLLIQHSINTQVQNAFAGEKNQQFFAADVDTTPFYGNAGKRYVLDDYTRFTTMEEVLREYVVEVGVRRQRGSFALKVLDDPHNIYFDNNPLVLADGVPFFNMDTVIALNPLKMRKVEIVPHKYYLGPLTIDGIISYTTYKGDLDGIQLDPSSLVLEYDGLQLQREFYYPKYDNAAAINSRLPDFRDVLYWSPDVKTDAKTGKTEASFYTSDVPGTYAVTIQGMTAAGKTGSKTFLVNVK